MHREGIGLYVRTMGLDFVEFLKLTVTFGEC